MYSLPAHRETNPAVIKEFISRYPFALLSGTDSNSLPVATQIPFFADFRDGTLFLSGHIMKSTDHHLAFQENTNVLALFTGPNTYVSASWYSKPGIASTWNYMSVHARGTIRYTDHDTLLEILQRTTDHYENNPASRANFAHLPKEYVERLSKAIVAFEIEVTDLEGVFKLSQDRDEQSYDNIIRELDGKSHDATEIAAVMRKRRSQLFKTVNT